MTIREYIEKKEKMGINNWIETIKADGLAKYEREIIQAADNLGKIKINENADFKKAVRI